MENRILQVITQTFSQVQNKVNEPFFGKAMCALCRLSYLVGDTVQLDKICHLAVGYVDARN